MPLVHVIGEIDNIRDCALYSDFLSLSWSIVPGNNNWNLNGGIPFGETQASTISIDGKYILNHPLDLIYDTSTSEGWPLFVCEAWTRSENARGFYGCGAIFLPTSPGKHSLDVMLWRPASQGLANLTNILLPELPDLRSLRELILNPYLRSQLTVESMGAVSLSMFVTTSGFEEFGVFLE